MLAMLLNAFQVDLQDVPRLPDVRGHAKVAAEAESPKPANRNSAHRQQKTG